MKSPRAGPSSAAGFSVGRGDGEGELARHLEREWNDTAREDPRDRCLHELIEQQVDRSPDTIAVDFEGEWLTYRELNARANRVAHALRRLGVGPEVLVGIAMERSLEMVVALLAVLKSGGAYVPLDPGYPRERLAFMLEDAEVPVLLTQTRLAGQLVRLMPQRGGMVLRLDADSDAIDRESDANPASGCRPDSLAYVIYTSGSTGRPKGAMNSHRGICNRLLWMQDAYGLTGSDRVLQKTPTSFDVSVWELFWPLMTGARLVVARPGGHQDSAYLVDLIAGEGITTLHFVPSMLRIFLEQPGIEASTSLERVICSGEALPFDLAQCFFARLGCSLSNLYGPTEAAVDVTAWRCEPAGAHGTVPIGHPITNLRIHLLDEDLEPVTPGTPGELYIGGIGVGRGYWHRPALTAERFVPDPFGMPGQPGARLYRSGDLARRLPDGAIDFLGRIDHQVKIRGFRIELGEIEAALRNHPEVSEAVVVAHRDGLSGDARLVAYVVGDPERMPTLGELRHHLRTRLPEHMMPAAFVTLEALPLSPNGKIDRQALPAPPEVRPELEQAFLAPRGATEERLAAIWADLLRLDRCGARDDFFELGGHSLAATQMISRVRGELGVELSLQAIFDHPNVASLARLIAEREPTVRPGAAPAIRPVPRDGDLPLSFSQERIWFLEQLDPTIRAYQFQATLRLAGQLDTAALERSLSEVVRRHEIFRTTLPTVGERPVQRFHPPVPLTLPVVDLSALPPARRAAETELRIAAEIERPFVLSRLPLVRWTLLCLAAAEHLWVHVEHHQVHDGWSFNVLLEEMAALYRSFSRGEASPLPEPELQFADFAVWQRRWIEGAEAAAQVAYWRRQLAGSPPALELPTDRPRPPRQTFRGRIARLELSVELSEALRAASRRQGVTLFMTMEAAFALLLSRYSGQDEVNVGSAVANRRLRETEGLIGMIVNNVVLRQELPAGSRVDELLRQVRRVCLEADAHQDVPFDLVVEAVEPPRDPSRNPLFQVSFSFHDSPLSELDFPGLETHLTEALSNGSAKFDLNVICIPRSEQRVGRSRPAHPGGITVVWEHNTALFERATTARMTGHWQTLLAGIAAHPEQRLSELPLLSDAERKQLERWNRTAAELPRQATAHALFEARADEDPGTLAVAGDGRSLSYGELETRANRLAHHLRALDVGPEVRVGVCLERSPELVVAILAVSKAGGAYLPLDPAHPPERLAFTLADAGAAVLLTREGLRPKLPASPGTRVLSLDGDREAIAARSATRPAVLTWPESLAYVIYTSGSTGRPKGTELAHAGLVNLITWHGREYGVTALDRATQVASPAFDASVWEIWPYLAVGASLYVPPEEVRSTPPDLYRWLADQAITLAFLPTPLAAAMLAEEPPEHLVLRALLVGGDRLARAPERPLPFRLVNHYGPTEGTVVTTSAEVTPGGGSAPPIGRPIANTRVHLLDRELQPVPPGVPGELAGGGVGLARGYLGEPALTAERFIPDPFGEPGSRLYRTGDLARRRPDGDLEFLGRIDHQVKVRGFRIEPGEVESALAEHPGIREAAVMARDERLVAFVVPKDGPPDLAALAGFLRTKLPEHMVPSAIAVLPALPLSPNGKVDRRALSRLEVQTAAPARDRSAPRRPTEELLAGIWSEVLGVESIGLHDDFFELGGHSLLATRVISGIRRGLGVEVPLRTLFDGPTVAMLATAVDAALRAATRVGAAPATPLLPVPRDRELPLSFSQERLWFLDRLIAEKAAYHIARAFALRGPLDPGALAGAVAALVRRHEALRTTFPEVAGRPVQEVAPAETAPGLPVIDLREVPEPARELEAERLRAAETRRPFDLATDHPLRLTLLRQDDDEHRLLLVLHHIAADGWSMGILCRELGAAYAALVHGRPPRVPPLPVQYADYAVWQRERIAGEVLDALLAFWTRRLAGAPELLDLPTDRPRPPIQSFRGDEVAFSLTPALTASLHDLARASGVTSFMVLLAAFTSLLGRYAGQDDLLVGSPVAGRNRTEIEGLIGFFVNTLVLRTRLDGGPTFAELLRRTRETTLAAFAHDEVPFERLVDELAAERSLAHTPLFQVLVVLQNAGPEALELAGLEVVPVRIRRGESQFDLSLVATDAGDRLELLLRYDRDLFDDATIARLAGHLEVLLAAAVAGPGQAVSELPLLTDAERTQLAEWSQGPPLEGGEECLHELVAAQARQTPDAVAVLCRGESLTYGELVSRAGRLARHLRSLGVGPETRVGVAALRSPDMLVGLLAILRAGGAYVPLDPGYPGARLALMVEDARQGQPIFALLTQERLQPRLPASLTGPGVRVVHLDAPLPDVPPGPPPAAFPDNLAYVIYTSGSTGRPKGVAIAHRSATALLGWARRAFSPAELAGVFASTSINFDLSVFELFAPLACGGRIVLGDDALALAATPDAGAVTLVNTVPSAMAELLRLGAVPPSARTVNLAGEPLRAALVERLYGLGTLDRVNNLYGPSEDTTYSTAAPVPRTGTAEPSIGRPLPGTRTRVLDADLRQVPVGLRGELYLAGAGLARGYLNRPDLTAERFLPDPFSSAPGARMYRTSDLARHRADGELEFLGRTDHQVKVRGFRIELGEIEAVLGSHPEVAEAVVVAREDLPGDRRLVAYVVPARRDTPPGDARAFLAERLPSYMLPSAFVALPALPLTPNGKVDRRALPAPEAAGVGRDTAPRSPAEELLAGIWAEVLGTPEVGVHANFFDLGGHSLLAIQVVSRVRRAFGVELPLRSLFEWPTVAQLAAAIETAARAGSPPPPPIRPAGRDRELPLSFAQERLWFLDRLIPNKAAYHLASSFLCRGPLDPLLLGRALAEVTRRHEALRTAFPAVDGRPAQAISPAAAAQPLPVVDLARLAEQTRTAEAERLTAVEVRRPFDLASGPLLRLSLFRLAKREHRLLVTIHHIVSDGWSIGLLLAELGESYRALGAGEPPALSELPVQYADYATWQRERLAGEALSGLLAYWTRQLAGAPALLALPTDRPRPAIQSFRGGRVSLSLPPALAAGLRHLARRSSATPFMVLLAGFSALLHRWTGQEDILLGSPVTGRTRTEIEGLIGFFVNTLVLRNRLRGDPAFGELVGRARETTLAGFAHDEVPFERLVDELAPERSLSHTPLFQVVFALQSTRTESLELPGLTAAAVPVPREESQFDLALSAIEAGERLELTLRYDRDLFDAATAARLAGHLEVLLDGAVARPDRRLSELPLLSESELRELAAWNRTAVDLSPMPVHELFAAHAEAAPAALAVAGAGLSVTYGELAARANRLARHLRRLGVGREAPVGLCLERSPALVVAALAALEAGAAYLPLDPSHPTERLASTLEDSGVVVLLTTEALRAKLPPLAGSVRVLALDVPGALGAIAAESAARSRTDVEPTDLAYVIYTSGSTGRPKGTEIPHAALANLAAWHRREYAVTTADRATLVASPAFDASVWEIWPYLTAGASVHVPPEEVRSSPPELYRWLAEQAITLCFLPTPLAEAMLAEEPPGGLALEALLVGGDRLHRPPDRPLPFRLVNHYGPTESAVVTTSAEVAGPDGRQAPPPIGRPIANLRVHLIDRSLEPVPVGVPGELAVAGAGLARGYLRRPDLTAAGFVPDPFGEPGTRLYRTGDLARYRPDGEIEFLGRTDHQVKVRGFRIELGEIEALLGSHPEVAEAVVVAREDLPGDRRLVAYVVPRRDASPGDARAFLAERLPSYMVPSAFVVLPALPLTRNGKVDRRALPAPEDAGERDPSGTVPRTPVEELLAGIWSEVLGRPEVGIHDGFFELGGHSLLATRVISRVGRTFGVELPLRALFEGPTVALLARTVEAAMRSGSPPPTPLLPTPHDRMLPLSFAQERLWFLDQLIPNKAAYHLATAFLCRGPLDATALAGAVFELVRRHEALRTVFPEVDGRPAQAIAPPTAAAAVPVVDLAGLAAPARAAEAERLRDAESRRPFDLAFGPPLRLALLRSGEHEHRLLLTLHHIAADGWSMGILFRELAAAYAALREGAAPELPPLPVQYADYAVWQRERIAGEALDRLLAYWTRQLAGAPALSTLPADRPRPPLQSFRGDKVALSLEPSLAGDVRQLARAAGVTPFMVLLACFSSLLGRHSGQDDLLVGSPVAGRSRAEIEGLIGFFVNTLVLRTRLHGEPTFFELLDRTRETTLGAFAHDEVPFERLVDELTSERSLAHTPLFQVLFALQNAKPEALELAGLQVAALPTRSGASQFDLSLFATDAGDRLELLLRYDRDLFDDATIARLAGHLEVLLAAAVAGPGQAVSELPLLTDAERTQLAEWSQGPPLEGGKECLHELVAVQARQTPDAVAVLCRGESLTYGELTSRAGRLARHLRSLGVGPETRVGVAALRSPEMLVGLLAILRAGGAYVPLDPGYPGARLALMVEDASQGQPAFVLLTQERLQPRLPASLTGPAVRIVPLDAPLPDVPSGPPPAAFPDNLAYVIYTSGSTGRPKGVAIAHRSATALLGWACRAFSPAELAGVFASTSINFDLSVFELFAPLAAGGRVILGDDALALAATPDAGAVTLVNTVPSAMAELLRLGAVPPSARTVNLAGEPLRAALVERLYGLGTVERVDNLYGPSEDTTYSTAATMPKGSAAEPTIGRPLPGTRTRVLDADLRQVPVGVPGELYLAGAGLARGYLNRPDLTAERFLPDPFSSEPGARMYRTSDLARHRADGELEFLGRTDHQVKVRGFRIELGEIEAVLGSHPEVAEAVVVAREDLPGDRRLVAYVVPARRDTPPGDARAFLAERLPSYMLPSAFVALPALPLTPNGKVDRRALPAPEDAGEREPSGTAPRTPVEELLAGIWAEVLGTPEVGVDDDFFALGGHSLLATRVVSGIRRTFGVELPLRSLFEHPTVTRLAAALDAAARIGAPPPPPLLPVPRDRELPLSFAQERLWFLDRLIPNKAAYHLATAFLCHGPLDPILLGRALTEVVRRHEALRTAFVAGPGGPVQVVTPPSAQVVPVVDLRQLDRRLGAEVARLQGEEARRTFDLTRGPLLRLTLLATAEGEHRLLVTTHHIVSDGWSIGLLLAELGELYRASGAGTAAALPELTVQYGDYAVWQRERLRAETLAALLARWQEHLDGAPAVLELPLDHPRPALQSFRGDVVTLTVSAPLAERLQALSRASGVTAFMTLLAAFSTLLGRLVERDDVVVGTPIAGRTRREVEDLIGLFVNTLALRTRLGGDPSFRELLDRTREATLFAYAHQELPFEKLVEALAPRRDLSHSPVFQVLVASQNMARRELALPGIEVVPSPVRLRDSQFDLALFATEAAAGLDLALVYDSALFDRATVQRLARHLETLLDATTAGPAVQISELPLLTPAEQHALLAEWNDTEAAFPEHRSIHELVEAQVEQAPDAPAVVWESGELTYGELERRANRLAHRLISLGAGPGELVGVRLERSAEMVVAVLGVLKAGAAYVPIESGWPAERTRWILAAHGITHLVTQASGAELIAGLPSLPSLAHVICLDEPAGLSGQPEARPPASAGPEDLAYVIFTSGSTGTPKGVMVRHRPVVNLIHWVNRRFAVGSSDRLLFVTALSFDLSVYDVFGILAAGAAVRLASPAEIRDPRRLLAILEREPITFWDSAPAALQHLASSFPPEPMATRVRLVFLSGDWIPVGLPERIRRALPGAQVVGLGGATEATVWSNVHPVEEVDPAWTSIPYGRPITNARYHVLDRHLHPCPIGVPGDLYIGGECLSLGYAHDPELTAAKYVPDPVGGEPGTRLYRTGDRARYWADGTLEFLGRLDTQVKVRGFRIELGEVESVLANHPAVRDAVVTAREDTPGDQRLVAYLIPAGSAPDATELRRFLKARIPEYMVPAAFVTLDAWPLSPTGKLDRRALPPPANAVPAATSAQTDAERAIAGVWKEVIGIAALDVRDNFFDLGGHSLLMARVHGRLEELFGRMIAMVDLFQYPTVAALAEHLATGGATPDLPRAIPRAVVAERTERRGMEIAIVGMAGRFPGAQDLEAFWRLLADGEEAIRSFTDEELLAAGVDPALLADPDYVKARGALADADLFDAGFFDVPPREAQVLDPQQRVFLECAWEALENAGYGARHDGARVGVYAGAGENTYLRGLLADRELIAAVGRYQITIANNPDYLPTRVSYKLDLQGPSVNVQTACSTSLVAVHLACLALLHGDCDMALAGGVTVREPEVAGYRYEPGGIASPDGHTRAFDAAASGTVTGSGAGIVVLKRLADAQADGDTVRAVIRGSAINNDGSRKVGFTAPSVEGQARAIRQAHLTAAVDPDTIGYVEAHGTGTALGDPIEIAGLTLAFRAGTDARVFCALGSVKTNVGHLDAAAGVTGLVKTVLAIERGQIPPSLHFREPNPKIDFAASPFYVNTTLAEWRTGATPRRAGVSAFGIGGTNAHVVLEEAPEPSPRGPARPAHLLLLSARTPEALEAATARLADHLERHPELDDRTNCDMADVAFTLAVGRRHMEQRRALVCRGREEAVELLRARTGRGVVTRAASPERGVTVFMFPGQGAQYPGMALELYRAEPVVRETLDRCREVLAPELGLDLLDLLDPSTASDEAATRRRLERTEIAQPALFAVELALAHLLMAWGIRPHALIGHSLGEYVAACLAGVFSFEDGLRLVAARGRLMAELPPGDMLSVALPESEVRSLLERGDQRAAGLALAAVNAPAACVVSGPPEEVAGLSRHLAGHGVEARPLATSHAFHSAMMEPILDRFAAEVARIDLRPPEIPYVSNRTGTWVTAAEATDPLSWVRHLRSTVRFADGLSELLREPCRRLLEVGPGRALATLAAQHPDRAHAEVAVSTLPRAGAREGDHEILLGALGKLWAAGVEVDWAAVNAVGRRRRVPLPTYPFERRRYWAGLTSPAHLDASRKDSPSDPISLAEAWPASGAPRPAAERSHVPPRNETEEEIADAWRELLGIERVGVHDDFFDLGGSSLLGLRLGARLRRSLGVELASDFLLEASTPADQAALVERSLPGNGRSATARARSCLVKLQAGVGRRPLFLVHQVGGHAFTFRALARELGPEQPVYGLRSRGLEEGEEPLRTIPEMASHYLELVRGVQSAGPYLLGGASMGGMVAFEMAQQLRAAGEQVALLGLMDTPCLEQMPAREGHAEAVAVVFSGRASLDLAALRRLQPDEQWELALDVARREGRLAEDFDQAAARRHVAVIAANAEALHAYEPRPYPARLLYFRAAERRPIDPPHPELPWIELALGGAEVVVVPGDHMTMHGPPHVSAMAEVWRLALELRRDPRSLRLLSGVAREGGRRAAVDA